MIPSAAAVPARELRRGGKTGGCVPESIPPGNSRSRARRALRACTAGTSACRSYDRNRSSPPRCEPRISLRSPVQAASSARKATGFGVCIPTGKNPELKMSRFEPRCDLDAFRISVADNWSAVFVDAVAPESAPVEFPARAATEFHTRRANRSRISRRGRTSNGPGDSRRGTCRRDSGSPSSIWPGSRRPPAPR